MQASTEEKQRYLREQILESHFDAEQFVSYLKDDLEIEQLDVQHLTMKTIQNIVLKFKQYKYYQNQSATPDKINQPPPKKPKVKVDYRKNGEVYDYEFSQICRCIHADSFATNLEVFVPNFQIKQIEGVFFSIGSRKQIWYVVKTNISKQPVKRLQEDFDWLSSCVARLFPQQAIPELSPIARDDEEDYEKRRKELETYLQILASREALKQSNIFQQFLTIPAEKMEKMKKNADSFEPAKDIQSIQNQSGEVAVQITNNLRNYTHKTSVYNRKIQNLHECISTSIQRVTSLLDSVFLEVNKIVNSFAEMHDHYNELNNSFVEQNVSQYNQILVNINNLFNVFSVNLSTTSKIIQTNLKQFYKLSLSYDKSISKLYANLAETEKDYVYAKSNLNRKKDKIYPDVTRWEVEEKLLQNRVLSKEQAFEIMLPRQTLQQNEKKLWLGYLYKNYNSEFRRYIKFEVKRYVDIFCTFTSELLLNNRNYVEELTKFIEESKKLVSA